MPSSGHATCYVACSKGQHGSSAEGALGTGFASIGLGGSNTGTGQGDALARLSTAAAGAADAMGTTSTRPGGASSSGAVTSSAVDKARELAIATAQQLGNAALVSAGPRMAAGRRRHEFEISRMSKGDIINGLVLFGKSPIFSVIACTQVGRHALLWRNTPGG